MISCYRAIIFLIIILFIYRLLKIFRNWFSWMIIIELFNLFAINVKPHCHLFSKFIILVVINISSTFFSFHQIHLFIKINYLVSQLTLISVYCLTITIRMLLECICIDITLTIHFLVKSSLKLTFMITLSLILWFIKSLKYIWCCILQHAFIQQKL
jgi:hypothetical protein